MNKYIDKFEKNLKNPPALYDCNGKLIRKKYTKEEKVVRALSIVNAMTLTGEYLANNELSNSEKNAIIEFVDFFLDTYGENKKLWEKIDDNWSEIPRIFQIYEMIKMWEYIQEEQAIWNLLTEQEKEQVEALTKIIWNIRKYRELTLTFLDGDLLDLELDARIPRHELKGFQFVLKMHIGRLLYIGGSLILFINTKEHFTAYGFLSENRQFSAIPKEQMKMHGFAAGIDYGVIDLPSPFDRFSIVN